MTSSSEELKIDDRFCTFVEDTISFFKMDINPSKWTEKNISDWFYWVRHKLRFEFPKINKDTLDLTKPEFLKRNVWIETFGEKAGLKMRDEFSMWLIYRDMKNCEERLYVADQDMKIQEDIIYHHEKNFGKERPLKLHLKANYECNVLRPRRRNEKKDGLYLWQILLRLLIDPLYVDIISWTDYHNGKFKIQNPEAVSKIWGESKGNPNMTYDKMSRSMRQYYKSKLLIKTNRDKLNYCFNMNDSSVKKFANRCIQHLPVIKRPASSEH